MPANRIAAGCSGCLIRLRNTRHGCAVIDGSSGPLRRLLLCPAAWPAASLQACSHKPLRQMRI